MNYFAGGSTPRRAPPTPPRSRQTPICHPRINHPRKNVSNIERMQKKSGEGKRPARLTYMGKTRRENQSVNNGLACDTH